MPLSERSADAIRTDLDACDELAWQLGESLGAHGCPVLMYGRRARRTLVGYSSDSSDDAFVSSDAERDDEDDASDDDDDDRRSSSAAAGGKISQTASAEDTDRAGTATPSPKKHQNEWASPVPPPVPPSPRRWCSPSSVRVESQPETTSRGISALASGRAYTSTLPDAATNPAR